MQLAVLGGSSLLTGAGLFKATILGASIAGSMIMNGRKKPTGKLNDVRVSSASYGRGIPEVWGTMRVTGNMFWATDFREEKVYVTQKGKEKTGGKGKMKAKKGKATPVYKYYANFAMGLCAGPMADVLRIWADNNLIYNKLNPDDDDLVGPGFSQRDEDEDSGKRSMKSAQGKKGSGGASGRFAWRFYPGDDQQMPDPYMEKKEGGKGKCPAYRDLCYLMFQDFALEDFGNRIPTITAEVVSKVTRKPQILVFENLDPPVTGWEREDRDIHMIDIVRGNFFSVGNDENWDRVIRIWDMDTRKETKRLRYKDVLPQTVVHGQTDGYAGMFGGERTWVPDMANDFKEMGLTPAGDLVLHRHEGNYGPIIFMDPANGKILKSWGRSGNILGGSWDAIFAPHYAFPIIGSSWFGAPTPYTLVTEQFGNLHIFDETYNKVGAILTKGRRENFRQGSIGTTQALLFTSTGYGGPDQYGFYYAPVVGPEGSLDGNGGNIGAYVPSIATETKLGVWPEVPGSKGNIVVLYDVAYIVGANCIGIIGGPAGGTPWVAAMDMMTGKIIWEKRLDGVSFSALQLNGFLVPKTYINTNGWTIEGGREIIKIDFHLQRVEIQRGNTGVTNVDFAGSRYYWSERDAMIGMSRIDGELTPVIAYQDRKVQDKVDIAEIVTDVAEKVGIEPERIRTGGIQTQEPLLGYMFEQPTDARSVLEELANVFQFDCVETDNSLVFKMRGGDPVVTIPEELLGVIETDIGTDNERISETRQQELELPERVTVSYYDPKNDYETGSQYFKRPGRPLPVMATKEHLEVTFNMSLLGKNAKAMAKRILYSAWSERTTQEFRLPRDFLYLDPSDVVTLAMNDGRMIECRITDITLGGNIELEITAVANLSESYGHTAETDAPLGTVPQPRGSVGFARPLLANLPYIDDSHHNDNVKLGYYWGAGADKPGFNFGMLQARVEDSEWATEGLTQVDAIWGYTTEKVPAPPGWNIEDTETEIKLFPAFDFNVNEVLYTWESMTDAEWPSTNNMIIIGDEIILFKNAVENSDGTVTISHLIRGYRGTIDAAYRHTSSDTWMVYSPSAIHLASDNLEYLLKQQQFIINTGNVLAPFVASRRFAASGGNLKPLPVGDVRRTNLANGDVTLRWSRSTRLGGTLKDGTSNIALNEESEQYVIFLLGSEYDASKWDPEDDSLYLWKSEILTSSQVTVPAATLSTVGLSNKIDLNVVIHQLSATVEWGFPHGLKLPYAMIGV